MHRKRTQVAVIDQYGHLLTNRTVANGAEPILDMIDGLPPGDADGVQGLVRLAGAAAGLRVRPALLWPAPIRQFLHVLNDAAG